MTNSNLSSPYPAAVNGRTQHLPEDLATEISACWNEAGTLGNGSCSKLEQFIHCRNCPTYSAAGILWLDQPLPPAYRSHWTAHFASEKKAGRPASSSAVLFRIQAEWLALPTTVFQEVTEHRRVHSLPHRRQGVVVGLVNVRGELLIAVSLGHLLGLEALPPSGALRVNHHRLLVANWEGSRFAFPVDEVHGPHRFHPQDLLAPPAAAQSAPAFSQAVLHWRDRAVGFLDAGLLFSALNRSLA